MNNIFRFKAVIDWNTRLPHQSHYLMYSRFFASEPNVDYTPNMHYKSGIV